MAKSEYKISDSAVKKATGKDWDGWLALLDREGASKLAHGEIAKLLMEKKHIKNGWWAQSVTVGYEYLKGRRTKGQSADAGFEIGAQKTFPLTPSQAWKKLLSPEGLKIWLGKTGKLNLKKGAVYKTEEGFSGEIRSFVPGRKIRLIRKATGAKVKATTIQVYTLPGGKYFSEDTPVSETKNTSVRFHQENLNSKKEREKMRKHWKLVLGKLEVLFKS